MLKKNIELSIVVPVYNEEENIAIFFDRIHKICEKILQTDQNYELIFVMDPSEDKSEDIIKKYCQNNKNVSLIKMSRRFGQAACTIAGIENSSGNYCVVIDVDLQDPPEIIENLYKKIINGYDVVSAKRNSRSGINFFYKSLTYLGYKFINTFSDTKIPENTGDFRIFNRKIIKHLSNLSEKHNFLRGLVSFIGFKQTQILYDRQERYKGEGHYSKIFGSLKISVNGLVCYSNFLLNFVFWLGLSIAIFTCLLSIFLILNVYFGSRIYPIGLSSIILSILFIGGVQLISLGIVGQYIARIYDETKNRPKYIIDEKINFINTNDD